MIMRFGIALATYNGAKFLREQLESLLRQSRPPDHVVISDDSSTDETLGIAEWFRRAAPYRVDIVGNQRRLGPMGNFLRAADACEADFIAFCDQDDIWMPTKLEICERHLVANKSFAAIHSVENFGLMTSGRHGENTMHFGTIDGLQIPPARVIWPGMAMVVRNDVLHVASRLKALWEPRFDSIAKLRPISFLHHWSHTHDLYALTAARLLGNITFVQDVLARHREHENNYSMGGSAWCQDSRVAESWGHAQNVGYRILSAFCKDFAEMLGEDECAEVLPEGRCRLARQHYERWSHIWHCRYRLHEDGTPLLTRMAELGELHRMGAYRGHFNGGLGKRSLIKDVLTAFLLAALPASRNFLSPNDNSHG